LIDNVPTSQPRISRLLLGLAVAGVLVAADQLVKAWVLDVLTPGVFVPFLGNSIGWQLVFNPGGAFGIPAPSWVFLVVTVVVVVVVARLLPRASTRWQAVALGMLLAGAIGNVIDRLARSDGQGFGQGAVVDFVAWGTFPRFNVADASITVGFALLVITMWADEYRRRDLPAEGRQGPGPDDGTATERDST